MLVQVSKRLFTKTVTFFWDNLDGDPGLFFLARSGLYAKELGCWILWLVFNGTDLHSGFSPSEDINYHMKWVDSALEPAWNMAGLKNWVVYVSYVGNLASNRLGSMNMMPHLNFGTYGSHTHNLTNHKNSEHENICLGENRGHANRLGQEAVSLFYNALLSSALSIKVDPLALLQEIEFDS